MYKVFVGFTVPLDLDPAAQYIDDLVAQHHGVVERRHPLHVTVMSPRLATKEEVQRLEETVEKFNRTRKQILCRLGALRRFAHSNLHYFVVEVKGQRVVDSINRFHAELEQCFSWKRDKYEGRNPHITLLSSKIVDSVETFDRVVREMGQLELPTGKIVLPSLNAYARWIPQSCSTKRRQVEPPCAGWQP